MNSILYHLKVMALAAFGSLGSVGLGILLAWLMVSPAWPHHAPSGEWVYPRGCCNSAATHPTGDCAPIPGATVREENGEYAITLAPGQHPKLHNEGYTGTVPYSKARPSPDGEYHICLSNEGAYRFCFFAPYPGW